MQMSPEGCCTCVGGISEKDLCAVIILSDFGAQENKICHYFHISLIYLHEVMGLDAMTLVF